MVTSKMNHSDFIEKLVESREEEILRCSYGACMYLCVYTEHVCTYL